jgi:NTE family protein
MNTLVIYINNPDMSVIKAIRISISMPFVFIAPKIGSKLYVDGGVVENYPLNAYGDKLPNRHNHHRIQVPICDHKVQ